MLYLPFRVVPGDGLMAPEHYDDADPVELLPISDADVEAVISNSTFGTVPSTDALKTSESTVGTWICPDSLHLVPLSVKGPRPPPDIP